MAVPSGDDLRQIKVMLQVIGVLVGTGLAGWSLLFWGLLRELAKLRATLRSSRCMLSTLPAASPATPPPDSVPLREFARDWKREQELLLQEMAEIEQLRDQAAMGQSMDAHAEKTTERPAAG